MTKTLLLTLFDIDNTDIDFGRLVVLVGWIGEVVRSRCSQFAVHVRVVVQGAVPIDKACVIPFNVLQ